jgi:signal transduction histidine kinase
MTGPRAAPGRVPPPPARGVPALLAAALAAIGLDITLPAVLGTQAGWPFVLQSVAYVVIWAAVGWVACRLRPDRRMGRLMILFGILVALNSVPGFGLYQPGLLAAVGGAITIALAPIQTPFFGHLLLAFPSGELAGAASRRLIRVAYGYALVEAGIWLLAFRPHSLSCGARCARNLPSVIEDPHIRAVLIGSVTLGWLPLAAWFAVLVVRRYRRAGRRERRVLAVPFAATAAIVVLFAGVLVYAASHRRVEYAASPISFELLRVISLAAVPVCFLIGLLRERLAYARVGDLVRDLGSTAEPASPDITASLARALGDPSLVVAFPVEGGHVDSLGRPVMLPPPGDPRIITPVGELAAPLALLIHDRTLRDEPALLLAAGSAARLALENARLHAQVRAQLEEVRASRARIVAASDETRRRLERDLHDGAQQRLLAVGLALQILRRELRTDGTAPQLLKEAETEVTAALGELRDLAAGIHPAILTDQGLRPAMLALAERCPAAVTVNGDDPGRLPGLVESAAYFCASEAVTNAVKHARAATIEVTLRCDGCQLLVTIADDGVGGASPDGTGLRGLADRVAAVGGRLSVQSPPGQGTRILVELPCAVPN